MNKVPSKIGGIVMNPNNNNQNNNGVQNTGAAVAAIGHYGFVSMHFNANKEHKELKLIGDKVHERLAEFPFWPDYDELIQSISGESSIANISTLLPLTIKSSNSNGDNFLDTWNQKLSF